MTLSRNRSPDLRTAIKCGAPRTPKELVPWVSPIGRATISTLRHLLFWSLVASALAVPLIVHEQQNPHGSPEDAIWTDAALQPGNSLDSRAAVAIGLWISEGRLSGWCGDNPTVTLAVPAREWSGYDPALRREITARVAGVLMRGVPDKRFVIRDDEDHVLATGAYDPSPAAAQ